MSHTKLLQCSCTKSFKTNVHMEQHKRESQKHITIPTTRPTALPTGRTVWAHLIQASTTDAMKPILCSCGKSFQTNANMEQHKKGSPKHNTSPITRPTALPIRGEIGTHHVQVSTTNAMVDGLGLEEPNMEDHGTDGRVIFSILKFEEILAKAYSSSFPSIRTFPCVRKVVLL